MEVDGAAIGLAGAAQIFRLHTRVEYLRAGNVYKESEDDRYGVTSLSSQEACQETLLGIIRGYWAIETKQHFRRDHTQREDHCQVKDTNSARVLSLMRSAAIFLYERKRTKRNHHESLADWLKKNHRDPNPLIGFLIGSKQ